MSAGEVVCVDVEGRCLLNDDWDKPRCARETGRFIVKIEIAMRYRCLVGKVVGVKCCGVQGCCVSGQFCESCIFF